MRCLRTGMVYDHSLGASAIPRNGPIPDKTPDKTVTLWPLPEVRHVYLLAAGILLGVLLGPAVFGRVFPPQYDAWFGTHLHHPELDQAYQKNLQQLHNAPEASLLPAEVQQEMQAHERLAREAMQQRLDTLAATQVTPQAIEEEREASERAILETRIGRQQREIINQRNLQLLRISTIERERQQQHHNHQLGLIGIHLTLVLALVAFALTEALLTPPETGERRQGLPPRLSHFITIRYALLAGWLCLTLAQPIALHQANPVFAGVLIAVVLIAGLVPLGKKMTDHPIEQS